MTHKDPRVLDITRLVKGTPSHQLNTVARSLSNFVTTYDIDQNIWDWLNLMIPNGDQSRYSINPPLPSKKAGRNTIMFFGDPKDAMLFKLTWL